MSAVRKPLMLTKVMLAKARLGINGDHLCDSDFEALIPEFKQQKLQAVALLCVLVLGRSSAKAFFYLLKLKACCLACAFYHVFSCSHFGIWLLSRKGYIAVPAYMGSLAEANTVPFTKPVQAGGQKQNIQLSHSIISTPTIST
eukprot:569189-Pelagomonas_calceolata.AAC.1